MATKPFATNFELSVTSEGPLRSVKSQFTIYQLPFAFAVTCDALVVLFGIFPRLVPWHYLLTSRISLSNIVKPRNCTEGTTMESRSLNTASSYINNLLLSRGLLRDGAPIDFAAPEKAKGGTDATMVKIMNLVHDLILRRDVCSSKTER